MDIFKRSYRWTHMDVGACGVDDEATRMSKCMHPWKSPFCRQVQF
jgi:hypothetical protein